MILSNLKLILLVGNIIILLKAIVQNVKNINALIVLSTMMKVMKKMNFGLKKNYLRKIKLMHSKRILKE